MTFGKTSPRGGVVVALSVGLIGLLALMGCGGSNDPRPAKWSYISAAILEPSCATANCHSAIAARSGVDLSTRAAGYTTLVDRGFAISKMVDATATDDERVARSPVLKLMRAQGNLRMPPDLPLPEPDILLIESWIRAGANND